MAQAGNRACKTQPCMQMGENELEWVSVTSGNMNVLNSALIFFVPFEGNDLSPQPFCLKVHIGLLLQSRPFCNIGQGSIPVGCMFVS